MQMCAHRKISHVRRRTVNPYHAIRKHGEVTAAGIRRTIAVAQGTAAIERIDHYQIAMEQHTRTGGSKGTGLWNVISKRFFARGFIPA
jgi:hypothetical protein